MDEGFLIGLATFLISNYTVLVWTVVDLTLILASRNIGHTIGKIKERLRETSKDKFRSGDTGITNLRDVHKSIAELVEYLGSGAGKERTKKT